MVHSMRACGRTRVAKYYISGSNGAVLLGNEFNVIVNGRQ